MLKFFRNTTALLLVIILATASITIAAEAQEFVPVRATFEALDAEVTWDEANGSITVILDGDTFVFFVNSQSAYVNGTALTLQNRVFIENDRAFIHPADLQYVLAQVTNFTDYPIIIGEGTAFPLDGILSMPNNATEQVPAVVLVHGSGPQDMDSTIFENRPFRDIAEYLAANGIAVIRYNKRTYSHIATMHHYFTVQHETIEDAVLAADMLRADPRIDSDRIFVIGLSLGGMLAPRIHAEGGDFAGIISLAGSPRLLTDIMLMQNIMELEALLAISEDTEERELLIATLEAFPQAWAEQMNTAINLPPDVAKDIPMLGATVYYFIDMYQNPMSAFIGDITAPMLIMQGSNDLQVLADIDFILFQELLAGRENVTFRLYEGLNHLFMPSAKTSILQLMDEYAIPARVDNQVLADIVAWIKGN